MAATTIISKSGSAITVYHNRYYSKNPSESWRFSVNVDRYRYKHGPRYNAEIVAERHIVNQNPEKITIFRSHRSGIAVVNEAYTLLQSLLQGIDNGDPIWDVRELLLHE